MKALITSFTIAVILAATSIGGEGGGKHGAHAHADHSPKHGGQFFMAPDKFHHLEGAMPSEREFRLYFYDDHTKPVSAKAFAATTTIEVDRMDAQGKEAGKPTTVKASVGKSGDHLSAQIPAEFKLPLYYSVRIKFPRSKEPELFNFVFDKVSKVPSKHHDHVH